MILGAHHAKQLSVAHLQEHSPEQMKLRREATGVAVPDIAEWHTSWVPIAHVQQWPVVMATALTASNDGRLDWVNGDPLHRFQWTLRTFVWARAEDYETTTAYIELLATGIAETFLARPGLAPGVQVQDSPLRISVSDVEPDRRSRASIAGAFVETVVIMTETATTPPVATADTVSLTVGLLPED